MTQSHQICKMQSYKQKGMLLLLTTSLFLFQLAFCDCIGDQCLEYDKDQQSQKQISPIDDFPYYKEEINFSPNYKQSLADIQSIPDILSLQNTQTNEQIKMEAQTSQQLVENSDSNSNPLQNAVNTEFCESNYECISTTFCCSTYSCVHPQICLHGQKLHSDICDYNFECLSRCCHDKCYEKCEVNSDCKMTNCCSEGYCTQSIVCNGNKAVGDHCEQDSECLTNFCFNTQCQTESILFPIWVWILIVGIVLLSVGLLALSVMYHFKSGCFRQKIDISLALNNIADHKSRREPLLAPLSDIGHDIIVQNTSRRFLYQNPRKIMNQNLPVEAKFHATPIHEVKSENQYYTYDPHTKSNLQSDTSSSHYKICRLFIFLFIKKLTIVLIQRREQTKSIHYYQQTMERFLKIFKLRIINLAPFKRQQQQNFNNELGTNIVIEIKQLKKE